MEAEFLSQLNVRIHVGPVAVPEKRSVREFLMRGDQKVFMAVEADPVFRLFLPHDSGHFREAAALQVEGQTRFSVRQNQIQRLVEPRDLVLRALLERKISRRAEFLGQIQLAEFRVGFLADPHVLAALAAGGKVVTQNRHAVPGEANVRFDPVRVQLDRTLKRPEGIFREFDRRAAVGANPVFRSLRHGTKRENQNENQGKKLFFHFGLSLPHWI